MDFRLLVCGVAIVSFGVCATWCASVYRDWKAAEAEISRLEAELSLLRRVDAQTRRVEKDFIDQQHAQEARHAQSQNDLDAAGSLSGLELYRLLDRVLLGSEDPAGHRPAANAAAGAGSGSAPQP